MPKKGKDFFRELSQTAGIKKVKGGKGGHQKVINPQNGKTSIIPMHSQDLSKDLEHKILKQLGLI